MFEIGFQSGGLSKPTGSGSSKSREKKPCLDHKHSLTPMYVLGWKGEVLNCKHVQNRENLSSVSSFLGTVFSGNSPPPLYS